MHALLPILLLFSGFSLFSFPIPVFLLLLCSSSRFKYMVVRRRPERKKWRRKKIREVGKEEADTEELKDDKKFVICHEKSHNILKRNSLPVPLKVELSLAMKATQQDDLREKETASPQLVTQAKILLDPYIRAG